VVEPKSGYVAIAKVSNKTADLVGHVIIKALTYDNGKEFCVHSEIDQALDITGYFSGLLPVGSAAPMRTSTDCCGKICPRRGRWEISLTRKLE
jgi:hypothetical protein